ncbi:MAG: hypothetical protein CFE26_14490 [Verrucomicrobiales bacterium VVV1]|nr:MAG: hypothetical protein CFE26_14490 [Verrucomicrobiales bacterium VVV1]
MRTLIAGILAVLAVTVCFSSASQNSLVTVYQPLWLSDEADPVLCPVPLVTGGAFPEVLYEAITMPHPPLARGAHVEGEGDVNAASAVGILLRCVAHPKHGYVLEFDLTQVDTKNIGEKIDEKIVGALLDCVIKTMGKGHRYPSRIVGGDRFPQYVKLIEARIPAELKADTASNKGGHPPVPTEKKGGQVMPPNGP